MSRSSVLFVVVSVLILCVLGVLTYLYLNTPRDARDSDATAALSPTEKGVFTDLSGNEVSFDSSVGRIRIVTTWASWNPFSVTDLQTLDTVAASFKENDIAFLAINRKETKEQAERFLNSFDKLSNIEYAIDTKDTFYTSIGGYAMPETVIYDEKGAIVAHKRGTLTEDELKSLIDEALQTK